MSEHTTESESPHDSDEQPYDTDAAAAIARDRLADKVNPAEFGTARDDLPSGEWQYGDGWQE